MASCNRFIFVVLVCFKCCACCCSETTGIETRELGSLSFFLDSPFDLQKSSVPATSVANSKPANESKKMELDAGESSPSVDVLTCIRRGVTRLCISGLELRSRLSSFCCPLTMCSCCAFPRSQKITWTSSAAHLTTMAAHPAPEARTARTRQHQPQQARALQAVAVMRRCANLDERA